MGGISRLIGSVLGLIMWLLYTFIPNYGACIALFTIIVRMLMFPISVKQQKSSAAMAAFSPKLEKLKKQYANNQQKLQEEQMKLYSEEGINPMASCLPTFIQLILLYGVFDVVYRPISHTLRISKEVVEAATEITKNIEEYAAVKGFNSRPELYIIDAVNKYPDMFADYPEFVDKVRNFNNTLFGFIDLGSVPNSVFAEGTVWNAATVGLMLIPIISGIIQLALTIYQTRKQKQLNPEASAQMGSMNMMLYIMPVFSVWMAYSFPAGIGFYWIMSSIVGFVQSIILHKIYTPEYVAKLIEKDNEKRKHRNKPNFMEKYNQMMQEQLAAQNGTAPQQNKNGITGAGVKKDKDEDGDKPVKLSKSQAKEYERKIIAEARRRQAEKYGDEYIDDDKE